jgi:hypothetical protein
MRIAFGIIVLLLGGQPGAWAADAASAPAVSPSGIHAKHAARRSRTHDGSSHVLACSPAWQEKVDHCDDRECGELYSQATLALRAEYDKFASDLADPASFIEAQKIWENYRDAHCYALNPTCPEGRGGSCSLPSAACSAALNCLQTRYLVQGECTLLNGYNERADFVEPDRCK